MTQNIYKSVDKYCECERLEKAIAHLKSKPASDDTHRKLKELKAKLEEAKRLYFVHTFNSSNLYPGKQK